MDRAPWLGTEFMSATARKAQAHIHRLKQMVSEIKALRKLSENIAKYAPHLVAKLHAKQGNDGVISGSFISYLLMTWYPGVLLDEEDYQDMPQTEKKKVFKAFKEALE